jgi:UDP-4-amino-4-deoxy-L-arabinose formyltransferase / UDP-glucuronic acid dehydrogenase (UDP-4-keto-hexauronic acid decarboxylating)
MKTLVFAYGEFGCTGIEALVAAGFDIRAVFTYDDDPHDAGFYRSVLHLCSELGIPAYKGDIAGHPEYMDIMRAAQPDFIFSFYYRSLLPQAVLSLARKGAYNLHGSLLPQYRGRAPVNWALVHGEKTTGVTLHHMAARADAGDIVAQERIAIAYADTAYSLQMKLVKKARAMLRKQLPMIARGHADRTPQDISKGSYYGRRGPEDGRIDWAQPAESVRNLVRAVSKPYPGAFTFAGDFKLLIWEASVDKDLHGVAGTVLSLAPLAVACGEGAIMVDSGQVDNGPIMSGLSDALAQACGLEEGMGLA